MELIDEVDKFYMENKDKKALPKPLFVRFCLRQKDIEIKNFDNIDSDKKQSILSKWNIGFLETFELIVDRSKGLTAITKNDFYTELNRIENLFSKK